MKWHLSIKSIIISFTIIILLQAFIFIRAVTSNKNILQAIQDLSEPTTSDTSLSNFLYYLNQSGLTDYVSNSQGITVFAPSNKVISSVTGHMTKDQVLYHIITNQIINSSYSAGGSKSGILIADTALIPTGSNVDMVNLPNVTAQKVIIRFSGQANNRLSIFFGSPVPSHSTGSPIYCSNGVIHLIDKLLTPPTQYIITLDNYGLREDKAAVSKVNLLWNLTQHKGLTIFAPNYTDDAQIQKTNESTLKDYVLYHAVNKLLYSSDLTDHMKLKTLSGYDLTVRLINKTIFINNQTIQLENIPTSNGVMHIISGYLDPFSNYTLPNHTRIIQPIQGEPNDIVDDEGTNLKTTLISMVFTMMMTSLAFFCF